MVPIAELRYVRFGPRISVDVSLPLLWSIRTVDSFIARKCSERRTVSLTAPLSETAGGYVSTELLDSSENGTVQPASSTIATSGRAQRQRMAPMALAAINCVSVR